MIYVCEIQNLSTSGEWIIETKDLCIATDVCLGQASSILKCSLCGHINGCALERGKRPTAQCMLCGNAAT